MCERSTRQSRIVPSQGGPVNQQQHIDPVQHTAKAIHQDNQGFNNQVLTNPQMRLICTLSFFKISKGDSKNYRKNHLK